MWLTSKSPAAVRVAMCSARMPEYSTGISHPPKFTILAPKRLCASFNAVLRSWVVVGDVTRDSQKFSANLKLTCEFEKCKEPRQSRPTCCRQIVVFQVFRSGLVTRITWLRDPH